MYFLVDAQLPIALARWIAAQGFAADHVHDIGMESESDSGIWREALRRNAVIVTKDEDFVAINRKGPAPQVVWIRLGNMKRSDLISFMERAFHEVINALQAGEKLIELR